MKNKKAKILSLLAFLSVFGMSACGQTETSGSGNETAKTSEKEGGFSFQPIRPASEEPSASPSASEEVSLNVEVLATVDKDGEYTVEAEDCDTSGCTLQEGCGGFYESPSTPTSGGECIACIAAPSILAFKFEAKQDCDIEFHTFSAKYENPWSLDDNVSYYLDEESDTPFVTNYQEFGRADGNDWYNWKDVTIGTKRVTKGVHQFNISVKGAFPNTDCFKLIVSNFGTEAAA